MSSTLYKLLKHEKKKKKKKKKNSQVKKKTTVKIGADEKCEICESEEF